jgi:parallel beta-helix repeat protein
MSSRFAVVLLVLLGVARAAIAVDGVIEINQVRALAGGVTPADAPGFPVTIGAPGSYRLTGNLSVADPDVHGIVVDADSVAIDLNGFEIAGPVVCTGFGSTLTCGAGTGRGIFADGPDSTTVQGGRVRGFAGGGVVLYDGRLGRIRDLIVQSNGAFGLYLDSDALVSEVRAVGNAGDGISGGGVIQKSSSEANRSIGIGGGYGASIVSCAARLNGSHGIAVQGGGLVRDSTATWNAGDGVHLENGGLVSGSVASGNGDDGIDSVGPSTLMGNTSNGNSGDGIVAAFAHGSTISGNSANDNVGLGIFAGEGSTVVGNTARSNGNFGLSVGSGSGWGNNVLTLNNGGGSQVFAGGGIQIGTNVCGAGICP